MEINLGTLAFLDSISRQYPGGITVVDVPAPMPHSASVILFLVAETPNSEEQALFEAAVTKGLKLKLSDVRLSSDMTEAATARLVVALGTSAWECLGLVGPDLVSGTWQDYNNTPLLLTHSLAQVLNSSEIKRQFWQDLKSIMAHLAPK